ncbi:MAG: polysaccharide deacetylase family protein [Clostridia bacterium]|nr:polysaccharide deacetylase family protein [Clostridia bacterium]
MNRKGRQILLMVFLLVLTVTFIGTGVYFIRHPIQFPEKGDARLLSEKPYQAYEAVEPSYQVQEAEKTEEVPVTYTRAEVKPRFYTTRRATVFTFSGLGNVTEVNGVLDVLRNTGSCATFFVTPEDLNGNSDLVHAIKKAGHNLGLSVPPDAHASVSVLREELMAARDRLKNEFGETEQIFVRSTYGSASSILLDAAGSCGLEVLSQVKEAVPQSITRMTNVEDALPLVAKANEGPFQRGEIVHFQMGLIQHSDFLLAELLNALIETNCPYPVESAATVAADTAEMYTYPLPREQILPEVLDRIHPGYLEGLSGAEAMDRIAGGYLGIDWVNSRRFLPGFELSEIRKLDKRGLIPNEDNLVFLTFDDWGTDGTVDRLLQVLEKHNVRATFFVRTQYVPYNPNLLRAIAKAGHTIGDHTHKHLKLSTEITATTYEELTDAEVDELREDMVTSYQTMQDIIGDLRDATGKPSLSTLFRPPTLAVGKKGLTAVFDVGFTHSISGYYTSSDYKAESAEKLARQLKRYIRSGAVIVMHFSDTAIYTAEALDMVLTELEQEKKPFRFVGLNAIY